MTPKDRGHELLSLLAWVAGTGVVVALGSGLGFGAGQGVSAGFGAGFAVVNLWVISRVVAVLLNRRGRRAFWTLIGLLKLGGAVGLLYVAFTRGWASPLWFGLGYGALPLGIVLAQGFAPSDRSLTAKES